MGSCHDDSTPSTKCGYSLGEMKLHQDHIWNNEMHLQESRSELHRHVWMFRPGGQLWEHFPRWWGQRSRWLREWRLWRRAIHMRSWHASTEMTICYACVISKMSTILITSFDFHVTKVLYAVTWPWNCSQQRDIYRNSKCFIFVVITGHGYCLEIIS